MNDVAPQARTSDIVRMDACALSDAIAAKKISCVEVMSAYLDQIERLNPVVNAIVSLRQRGDCLDDARERDAELARGEWRGWMHGFPQAIKDFAAAKGLPMTKGSPLLRDFFPEEDAIFVARMKAAGAIVIGKTNTPEFALGSHTFNPVFGTTLNAYDQSKAAGGSSGGAAVALAAHAARRRRQRSCGLAAQPGGLQQRARPAPLLRPRAVEHGGCLPSAARGRRADGAQDRRPRPAACRAGRLRPPRAALDRAGSGDLPRTPRASDVKGLRLGW